MRPLYLHAIGHFHPANVIDNRFLEELDIGTNDEWILERVGIRTRRTVLPLDYIRRTRNADTRAALEAALHDNADTGRRAAEDALARAGLRASDIGMVVAGGCYPDMSIPADACRIAAALGIEATALDVSSACSSFGAQIHLLGSMTGLPPYVLIVNPENTTRAVDYSDRATAVLWGDATSAAIVSTEVPSRLRIVETMLGSSPSGANLVTIPRSGHFTQDGSAVQRFAIKTTLAGMSELLPPARERARRTGGAVRFVGHQANALVLEAVTRRAEIAAGAHFSNVADFGNTGAAGAPTVLSQRWNDLTDGDTVVVVVVGSGLTWAGLRIEVEAT
ncbi:3-oxoacyl-[acyl-carrier-protein] synthase, KASIII [Labilithrix luteola]|uniref:3-oxoacyl-[acyl-carrier-protein] synthase, KASIII n=1 Tax=Labilithrix luteola TaxID=1391654 RepID=A0A0K1PQK5_9BACT|nr:ketoacyl-ACP synthase III [Labilithrix luteola]AKU95803.1 3-oxoacyl-[acyl-carrier-protein] synthase, KASIII [Labilithrix luteola]